MLTLSVDSSQVSGLLNQLADLTKKDFGELLRQEARLLAVELAKYTQPFGFDPKSKSQGEGAIKRDLFGGKQRVGIFVMLADSIIDQALATGVYQGANVRLFVNKNGDVYGADKNDFWPNATMSQLASYHAEQFKNGVMSSAGSYTRDVGRWKFFTKKVIRQSTGEKYYNQLIKHVGFAKAGWSVCAAQLGGTRGIPQWVTRHRKAPGRVEDNSNDPAKPSITLKNEIDFTRQVLSQAAEAKAVRDRVIKLEARVQAAIGNKRI